MRLGSECPTLRHSALSGRRQRIARWYGGCFGDVRWPQDCVRNVCSAPPHRLPRSGSTRSLGPRRACRCATSSRSPRRGGSRARYAITGATAPPRRARSGSGGAPSTPRWRSSAWCRPGRSAPPPRTATRAGSDQIPPPDSASRCRKGATPSQVPRPLFQIEKRLRLERVHDLGEAHGLIAGAFPGLRDDLVRAVAGRLFHVIPADLTLDREVLGDLVRERTGHAVDLAVVVRVQDREEVRRAALVVPVAQV